MDALDRVCGAISDSAFACTMTPGHAGPKHRAERADGHVYAEWSRVDEQRAHEQLAELLGPRRRSDCEDVGSDTPAAAPPAQIFVTMFVTTRPRDPNRLVAISSSRPAAEQAAQADFDYDERGDTLDWRESGPGDETLCATGEPGDDYGAYEIHTIKGALPAEWL